MLINREKAIAAIEALEPKGLKPKGVGLVANITIAKATATLRALPVSDGWEDIATYEGHNEVLVWCQCEESGKRWTSFAHKERDGRWHSDIDGYVNAKGWRPLPAPPSE